MASSRRERRLERLDQPELRSVEEHPCGTSGRDPPQKEVRRTAEMPVVVVPGDPFRQIPVRRYGVDQVLQIVCSRAIASVSLSGV